MNSCTECKKDYTPVKTLALFGQVVYKDPGLCGKCRNAAAKVRGKEESAAAWQEIVQRRATLRQTCGMPAEYHARGFGTWKRRAAPLQAGYNFTQEYATRFPVGQRPYGVPSLFLWSGPKGVGTGKTLLAASVVNSIIGEWEGQDHEPWVKWYSEPRLFADLQATFNYTDDEREQGLTAKAILSSAIHCDLLVLDDVGKEKRNTPDFVQRTLFDIIDGRDGLGLPIILTSNLPPDGRLQAHLGAPSYSRFLAMCKGRAAQMDGEDYRQVQVKEKD